MFLDSLDGNDLAADGLESGVIGSGGRAALSTIPSALVRWSEESRVIDGDSLHDAVTGVKPQILEQGEAKEEFALIYKLTREYPELLRQPLKFSKTGSYHFKKCFQS